MELIIMSDLYYCLINTPRLFGMSLQLIILYYRYLYKFVLLIINAAVSKL